MFTSKLSNENEKLVRGKTAKIKFIGKAGVVIKEYLKDMEQNGRTEATLKVVEGKLIRFFMDTEKQLDELTSQDILQWLKCRFKGKSKKTYMHNYRILDRFLKFAYVKGYTKVILMKRWWKVRNIPKSIPKHLNRREYAQVKIYCEKLPIRDRAIIEVLLTTGIRRQELMKINIEDIDLHNRTIKVHGKGNKIRVVSFPFGTQITLKKLIEKNQKNNGPLLMSTQGNGSRLSSERIYQIVGQFGKELNFRKRLTPVVFRHTYATHRLMQGEQIGIIQRDLGHKRPTVTDIYARYLSEEFKKKYHAKMG